MLIAMLGPISPSETPMAPQMPSVRRSDEPPADPCEVELTGPPGRGSCLSSSPAGIRRRLGLVEAPGGDVVERAVEDRQLLVDVRGRDGQRRGQLDDVAVEPCVDRDQAEL